MILFEAVTDKNSGEILTTLALLVVNKFRYDQPTNVKLKNLENEIGNVTQNISIRDMLRVIVKVSEFNKYSDASIMETYYDYLRSTPEVSQELIKAIDDFNHEYM